MGQNVHQKFTEAQNKVRLFIMDFIVSEKRPFHVKKDCQKLLAAVNIKHEEYERYLHVLEEKDGVVKDEEQNVNFVYPVSALTTCHQVTLADGRTFSAMCAIDAIGAAFTFHQDTEIHSMCAVCEQPVHIKIKDETVIEYSPQKLHALTFPLGELTNWAGSC